MRSGESKAAHGKAVRIRFDSRGGNTPATEMFAGPDGRLAELPVPTRGGYTFAGWYTMAEDGEEVTAATVFRRHHTLCPLDKKRRSLCRIQSKSPRRTARRPDRPVMQLWGGAILYRRAGSVSETGTHEKKYNRNAPAGAAWPGRAFLEWRQKDPFIRRGDASQHSHIRGNLDATARCTRSIARTDTNNNRLHR